MHFKNTDMGRWGAGEGQLPSLSVDENFWEALQRLSALEENPPDPISVDHITNDTVANTFTIYLTDGYAFGPFNLPTARFNLLGEWEPLTLYAANAFITEGGNTYLIQYPHTSAATFDPGANDGLGHNYYGLLPFPNAPIISWLEEGWLPNVAIDAFKVFSIADVGVFLTLHAHTPGDEFDATLTDEVNREVYLKIFGAVESNIARIQFQYPGTPPGDASAILIYIQDDDRDLVFAADWPSSLAHLETPCTDTIEWVIAYKGEEIGRVTFQPGELDDGEGGQYGVVAGIGGTIAGTELLKVHAPGYADATAKFLTLSLIGSYQDPS